MAYFPNSSAGECFDEQCSRCKYGQEPCPIFQVQIHYNYDACNNEVARKILDDLISNNGTCVMFEEFKEDFAIDVKNLTLYDELFNNGKPAE